MRLWIGRSPLLVIAPGSAEPGSLGFVCVERMGNEIIGVSSLENSFFEWDGY